MKAVIILFWLFLTTLCFAKKTIVIDDSEKNPTEYVFNFPMDTVRNAIQKSLSWYKYCKYSLKDYTSSFFKNVKNPQKTDNDFLLMIYIWADTKCRSKVYFNKKGKPYLYFANFFIHLTETDNGISVSIHAEKPQIYVGRQLLPNPAFLSRGPKFKEVPSSTVEEYEILLIIGEALGINDMPDLKIPSKIIL